MESAAQIWIKAAIDAFNEKNYSRAAECYREAAKKYKDAYVNAKTTQEKEFYKTEHNFCAERYEECKNPKVVVARPQRAAMVSQSGSSIDDVVDEDAVNITIEKQKPLHTFEDIGGMEKLKKKLYNNVIETYVKPHELDELKETSSQNYLLYGKPGCGKTYILEALVGEMNKRLHEKGKKEVTFISVTLSTLKSKYVGETEKRIHAYFKEAAKNTPCALLIDEIDSVGSKTIFIK
jgi:SpoVK/Ycf46/Vps4 family AAA+-type ATPase